MSLAFAIESIEYFRFNSTSPTVVLYSFVSTPAVSITGVVHQRRGDSVNGGCKQPKAAFNTSDRGGSEMDYLNTKVNQ